MRDNLDIIFIIIVLVSVIPIGIEVLRGLSAKRQAAHFGTDAVDEYIEEHAPAEERKTNMRFANLRRTNTKGTPHVWGAFSVGAEVSFCARA